MAAAGQQSPLLVLRTSREMRSMAPNAHTISSWTQEIMARLQHAKSARAPRISTGNTMKQAESDRSSMGLMSITPDEYWQKVCEREQLAEIIEAARDARGQAHRAPGSRQFRRLLMERANALLRSLKQTRRDLDRQLEAEVRCDAPQAHDPARQQGRSRPAQGSEGHERASLVPHLHRPGTQAEGEAAVRHCPERGAARGKPAGMIDALQ